MSTEILPSGTDGLEQVTEKEWDAEIGEIESTSYEGPVSAIESQYDTWISGNNPFTSSEPVRVRLRTQRGRGTVTATTERRVKQLYRVVDDSGMQELLGVDVSRPLYLADYFSSLTNAEILEVRAAFEDGAAADGSWSALQDKLYGHLVHGMEEYWETAYIFRQTYSTTDTDRIRADSSEPNTVQSLPRLSWRMRTFIDSLPTGEWIRKPTRVQHLGRQGFEVSVEYQWAKEWSVIYGGSFTGA